MQKIGSKDCGLCGSSDKKHLFTKNSYAIVKCCKCGLTYVNLDVCGFLEDYYNEDYFRGKKEKYGYVDYHQEKEYNIHNFRKYWKRIEPYVDAGNVLDIGCATGLFLECAGSSWQRYGLDISDYASNIARINAGANIETCRLSDAPWQDSYFDLITMWDVLDHLPDPAGSLLKCHRLLKKQGVFVFNVGDISALFSKICREKWYIMIPPTHLYFFDARTIMAMLEKAGFEVIKIERTGKLVSLRICFFRLSYIFNNPLTVNLFRRISHSRVGDIKMYFNFYDIMTIYSRKR